jgi:hypothetical protein
MNQKQPIYVPQMASIAERVNSPARLVQCIQMHNEEEFAPLVLRSIYNEVDRIIVIEGAVENRPNSTEDGHSIDRTVEIINDFKDNHDPDNKVVFLQIKKPWKNLEEIKQTFIDMSFPGDWLLINDADEFYRPEDVKRLRMAIDLNPHITEFVPTFLHFYRDFKHVAVPGPEWQPQHQRIFKRGRNMKYNSHPVVTDESGHCTYFSPHYQPRRGMMRAPMFIYHYGYARMNMDEVMQRKQEYYTKELAAHGGANIKFDQKIKDWFGKTEPLLFFDGEHPEVMSGHPIANVPSTQFPNEILWSEDPFYKQVLAEEDYGNIYLCMTKQAQPFMNTYHNAVEV